MTDEQIISLVKEYFEVGGIRDDGSFSEYYGKPDAFLKFAREIYGQGLRDGYDDGYSEGVYDGGQ